MGVVILDRINTDDVLYIIIMVMALALKEVTGPHLNGVNRFYVPSKI